MKVVVLGATGNIGTAVLDRLVSEPDVESVVAVARRLPETPPSQDVTWRQADIGTDLLEPVVGDADALVSLAWLIQPSRDPSLTWRNNVIGMARLLETLSRSSVGSLVVSSSVAAYSPAAGELVDESWPTHGASGAAYAREKAYVERLLDAFEARQSVRQVVRVRPAFTFQRASGVQQRRLFMTPLVPNRLVQPGRLPVLPWPRGLTLQVAHARDVADVVVRALIRPVRGAFNVASDDVLDRDQAAELFGARAVDVPPVLARRALGAAWRSRLSPAPPQLFDALMTLPTMSTERAKRELDWHPSASAADAVRAFLHGVQHGEGRPTPPLDPESSGPAHVRELASGVGGKP